MSRLGFKSVVFHGDACLGELDIVPVKDQNFRFPNNEIRIHHISQYSERCPPISILQTISSFAVCCKLESTSTVEQAQLINLHASCFHERQTAVVLLGEEEVHLVAMPSKMKKFPCFWCYLVPSGLYNSCLRMLNLRCLSMVFDLDETLIVANTMKSFEDRIEALQGWIAREMDSVRVSGMSAELKRYVEDRALLKQYAESDCVVDSGKVYKTLLEEVPPVCAGRERVVRPVIRLPEKNIVLTRITPEIRDTSVLVRLRPAWEDLRSYLTAKGRKRFEVYVCTMAERDYALEIWRLLDPEAHLISSELLLDRVVCVKSGARKSLLNVFPHGICHPKMAMVIDDRLKVWEDKDQPRVHVVPAFTPYYAPQAETANAVPVLCVARNVACNVRGGFFKEFDENLLRRISQLFYEDDVVNLPSAPDVSNYLMSEDASFQSNGNANAAIAEGMNGPEVAQRLNYMDERKVADSATLPTPNGPNLRPDISQLPLVPSLNIFGPSLRPALMSEKPSLLGAPCRRDNSFPEFNPDMRRRFFMTNPSQDVRPYMSRLPAQPHKPVHPQGGWLVDEDSGGDLNGKRGMGNIEESDALRPDKQGVCQSTVGHGAPNSAPVGILSHTSQMKSEERSAGNEALKQNLTSRNPISEAGMSQNQSSFSGRELQADGGKMNLLPSPLSIGVLQEIGRRCSSKIEFRSIASTSDDLQFSFEVLFTGEKIGVGIGKTRKDAQQQAAENALRSLADKYVSYVLPRSGAVHRDFDKLSFGNENGFLWDIVNPGSNELPVEDGAAAEVSELAPRSTADNMVDQRGRKRANSPRLSESNPNKRTKEEVLSGYGPIYS